MTEFCKARIEENKADYDNTNKMTELISNQQF